MRQKSGPEQAPAEQVVKDIRRATRRQFSAEEKIRIVLEGVRGEESIAELCRREGIASSMYYGWSKEFLDAGKRRLAGDTARAATSDEVKELRREAQALKEAVADLTLENRLLKKRMARPPARGFLRCSEQSASTYTVSWACPWPRWTSARLEPHKHVGTGCAIFLIGISKRRSTVRPSLRTFLQISLSYVNYAQR